MKVLIWICVAFLICLAGFEVYMFSCLEATLVNFLFVSLAESCIIIILLLLALVKMREEMGC